MSRMQMPNEGVRSHGTRVADRVYELPTCVLETKLKSSENEQALLSTEPSVQMQSTDF